MSEPTKPQQKPVRDWKTGFRTTNAEELIEALSKVDPKLPVNIKVLVSPDQVVDAKLDDLSVEQGTEGWSTQVVLIGNGFDPDKRVRTRGSLLAKEWPKL